jgi:hypothetical protein
LTAVPDQRFEFTEQPFEAAAAEEPGFRAFVNDPTMSGTVTESELKWLKGLSIDGRHPVALFYYRALQVLRDPLNFTGTRP